MYPAAEFALQCGEVAVEMVERMEHDGKVGPYTLKPMEPLVVPEDFHRVASQMLQHSTKATAMHLRDVCATVLRERWWTWCLLHPELADTHIHPTRSMLPLFTSFMAP